MSRSRPRAGAAARDRSLAAAVSRWFRGHARALPWRGEPRDPYASLVSEFMLQQTQVSRVLEKFAPFMARFPSARALAAAPEQEVLAAWSGLGYYRRAKHLHAAARAIAARPDGRVPAEVGQLLELPGVGRYTAGAIASMVFGRRAPLVDGNVTRVLLRIEGRDLAHGSAAAARWSWARAGALVGAARDPGAFNEGLMELGATVCTPRNPACGRCPVERFCAARERGLQHSIPRPRAAARRRELYCASVLIRDRRGRLLVEPRGERGLWANLWQAPTLETPAPASGAEVGRWVGLPRLREGATFEHATTHRAVVFAVWHARTPSAAEARRVMARRAGSRWLSRGEIEGLPLSNPQRRIMLPEGVLP